MALFGELRSEFLFLLFELVELHFNEFMMFQHSVKSGEELRAQALLADLESGFEPLGLGFEISDLRIGERIHVAKLPKSALDATKKTNIGTVSVAPGVVWDGAAFGLASKLLLLQPSQLSLDIPNSLQQSAN